MQVPTVEAVATSAHDRLVDIRPVWQAKAARFVLTVRNTIGASPLRLSRERQRLLTITASGSAGSYFIQVASEVQMNPPDIPAITAIAAIHDIETACGRPGPYVGLSRKRKQWPPTSR